MTFRALLLLLALSASAAAKIDTADWTWKTVDKEVIALCLRVEDARVPATHWPSAEERKALEGCRSEPLYYGIGMEPDPVKARHCALIEAERGDGWVFGDKSVLMMLYANGLGVRRDIDLAQRFACEVGHAPVEISYRQAHLESLRPRKAPSEPRDPDSSRGAADPGQEGAEGEADSADVPDLFDLCDDVTSGFMQGHCTHLEERRDSVARDQRLFAMHARWTEREQASFDSLHQAFKEYAEARSMNEVDLSGTARAAFIIGEESRLRNLFVAQVAQFEDKRWFPKFTATDLAAADKEINAVYRKIQNVPKETFKGPGSGPWGTVDPEDIRAAQRAWLKYRDAWVAFGAVKYPHVKPEAWKAWQTRERLKLLREFEVP